MTHNTGAARPYLIRAPRPGDVEGFAALHARVWVATYRGLMDDEVVAGLSVDAFTPVWSSVVDAYAESRVPEDGRGIAVAVQGEEPVGFLMHGPARDEDPPAQRQLWSLNVAPEHQGTGIAQRLMDEVFGAGPAYLWVARGNDRAIAFYQRNGFALDGAEAVDRHEGVVELRMVRG